MQINVQILPAVGSAHGHWEIIEFSDFLRLHSPNLSMYVYSCHQFPPFHILNEELLTGGREMGMSGGCLWKPFQIEKEDYEVIKEEMLTDPEYNLAYDEDLAQVQNLKKWSYAILKKYNPRKINES